MKAIHWKIAGSVFALVCGGFLWSRLPLLSGGVLVVCLISAVGLTIWFHNQKCAVPIICTPLLIGLGSALAFIVPWRRTLDLNPGEFDFRAVLLAAVSGGWAVSILFLFWWPAIPRFPTVAKGWDNFCQWVTKVWASVPLKNVCLSLTVAAGAYIVGVLVVGAEAVVSALILCAGWLACVLSLLLVLPQKLRGVQWLFFSAWCFALLCFVFLVAHHTKGFDPDQRQAAIVATTIVCSPSETVLPTVVVVVVARPSTHGTKLDPPGKLGSLKVFVEATSYAELDRNKAAEFGLEKVTSVVNYLLLATAGVLAFVLKFIMDLRTEKKQGAPTTGNHLVSVQQPLAPWILWPFVHGGIACALSLFCGVAAYLFLPTVGTHESFSIYNELGICVACQILSLLFAILLLVIALVRMVYDLLP